MKLKAALDELRLILSLPVRERGLKRILATVAFIVLMSLPVRERGLKLSSTTQRQTRRHVAPRAGAWIETSIRS